MPPSDPDVPTLPPRPSGDGTLAWAGVPSAPASPVPGYELLGELARGGMGVVYKARDTKLDRVVALKMVLAGRLATAADRRRFRTEAEAAARLDHPNIVPVYEVGEHDGQPYFTMAYVAGGSLAARVAAGPLPVNEAATLTAQLTDAIQYAHESGVVHRDLKPANVLLDERGVPKVADFGLAKRPQAGDGPTATGDILGTPAYMPPEQAGGRAAYVGPAADIYSLGAVLFALLTGRPPFVAATTLDTLLQVLREPPPRPSALRPGVPRDLETVCLKCLEKDPARRYTTAKDLGDDLRRYLAGEPVKARRAGLLRRGWAWARKRPWVLSAGVAVLLVAVSCLAYGLRSEIRERGHEAEYWQARAGRLVLRPGDPAAADAVRNRLTAAARVRPDARLYAEFLELLRVAGDGVRRLPDPPAGVALDGLTWSADGTRLLAAGVAVEVPTGRIERLRVGDDSATSDPTRRWLAWVDRRGVLTLREVATGRERRFAAFRVDDQIQFSADGGTVAFAIVSGKGQHIAAVATEGDAAPVVVAAGTNLTFALSGDGRRLAYAERDGSAVAVITTDGRTEVASFAGLAAGSPRRVALSYDGGRVAWTNHRTAAAPYGTVAVADAAGRRVVATMVPSSGVEVCSRLAFAADGRRLHGLCRNRIAEPLSRVVVWDAATGGLLLWVPAEAFAVGAGPGGELAAIGHGRAGPSAIDVWRPDTVRSSAAAAGLLDSVTVATFNSSDRVEAAIHSLALGWPAFCVAAAGVVLLAIPTYRHDGREAPVWLARVGAVAGIIGSSASLMRYLAVFDLPGRDAPAIISATGIATGLMMIGVAGALQSLTALARRRRGEPPPPPGGLFAKSDLDWAVEWLVPALNAAILAWPLYVVVETLDGHYRVFSLAQFVMGTLVAYFVIAMVCFVPITTLILVRRRFAARKWAVPALPRGVRKAAWASLAVAAGCVAIAAIWPRWAVWRFDNLPALSLGEIELTSPSPTFEWPAWQLAVALAVCITAVSRAWRAAPLPRLTHDLGTNSAAHAVSSANIGGSGGSA